MLKFIGKALAGMVLTKEAREAAGGLAKSPTARQTATKMLAGGKPDAKAQAVAIADAQAAAAQIVTNDRAELIRQAMAVRASKQSLLADLNPEDRAKLVATAMRAFLAEAKPKE